jgi:hypothetical protein
MYCFPKQLLLLLFSILFSVCLLAQNDHATAWREIDSLLDGYEPIKASRKLDQLFLQVQKEKKDDQWVKCLVYQIAFLPQNNDLVLSKSISQVKQSIDKAPTAQSKALLRVLLAKKYLQIYQENHERIDGRMDKPNKDKGQIQTWINKDFEQAVLSLYRVVISDSTVLKTTPINNYVSLLENINSSSSNTLYEFVLNQMVADLFMNLGITANDNSDVYKSLLLPLDDFLSMRIGQNAEWKYYLLKSYQQMMQYQIKRHHLNSLLESELERLKRGLTYSKLPNSQDLYIKNLENLASKYKGEPECIKIYEILANEYVDSDRGISHSYKETMQYLQQIKKIVGPNTFRKSTLSSLEKSILETKISYPQVENINYPGKPFRVFIEFRNVDTLYTRIIKASPLDYKGAYNRGDFFSKACQAIPVRSESIAMPFSDDYVLHRTEFKVDALEQSGYILLVSNSPNFNYKEDQVLGTYFVVSPFINYHKANTLFLRDLNSGLPIAGAGVSVSGIEGSINLGVTNPDGELDFSKLGSFSSKTALIKIVKGVDSLVLAYDGLGSGKNRFATLTKEQPIKLQKMLFYTDKAKYQQGQLIQFKGLVLDKIKDKPQETLFAEKKRFKVYLNETRGKKVDSVLLESNELGSVAGSFKISQNLKVGDYTISGDVAESSCSDFKITNYQLYVKNYAASGFSINLNGIKSCYKINDTVFVNGQLIGSAGNLVGGAKISFSINQLFQKDNMITSTNNGWLKGNTITDATGGFKINFPASANDTSSNVYFRVHIIAETLAKKFKTTDFSVFAGNQYLILKVKVPEIVELKHIEKELKWQVSEKYGNKKVEIPVVQQWYKIQTENRLIRKRQWSKPDLPLYSKEVFVSYFPHDEYDSETDINTLKAVPILGQPKEPGLYKVCIQVNDSMRQQANDSAFVYLYDPKQINDPYLFGNTHVVNQNPLLKDSIQWISFAANQSLFIQRTWIRGNLGFPDSYVWSKQDEGIHQEKIAQSDRGGIIIKDAYIWQGRFYEKETKFKTRFDLDPIKIQYKSYRQKNFIDSKETWTLALEGENLDPASMEMMSVMYDANLDSDWSTLQWKRTNNNGPFYNIVPLYVFNYGRPEIPQDAYYEYRYKQQQERSGKAPDLEETSNNTPKNPSFNESLINILLKTDTYTKPVKSGAGPGKYFPPQDPRIEEAENKSVIRLSNKYSQLPDLKETVFFFPQLRSDKNGLFQMQFEFPNISTKWNWMTMVHSKELFFAFNNETVNTQKQIFVEPDFPTKLVAGKSTILPATITNLTDNEMQGSVTLELFDAITKQKIEGLIGKTWTTQQFLAKPGMPIKIQFDIQLPAGFNNKLTWRIMATAGNFSDGEENDFQVND